MKAILSRLAAAEVPFLQRSSSKQDLPDEDKSSASIAVAGASPVPSPVASRKMDTDAPAAAPVATSASDVAVDAQPAVATAEGASTAPADDGAADTEGITTRTASLSGPPAPFKRRSSVIATGLLARRLSEISSGSQQSEVRGQISSSSSTSLSGDTSPSDGDGMAESSSRKRRTASRTNSVESTGHATRRARTGTKSGGPSAQPGATALPMSPDNTGMDISEALDHHGPKPKAQSPPTLTRRLSILNVGVALPATAPPMMRRLSTKASIDSTASLEGGVVVGPRSVLEDAGASDTAAQNKMASAEFQSITAAVTTGANPPSPRGMMAGMRRRSVASGLGTLQDAPLVAGELGRRFSIKSQDGATPAPAAGTGSAQAPCEGEPTYEGKPADGADGTVTKDAGAVSEGERSVGPTTTDDEVDSLSPERWNQWGQMLADWDTYIRWRGRTVRQCVREGIPAPLRGLVWQRLSKSYLSSTRDAYEGLLQRPSSAEKQIRRDIVRTFPLHSFFAEREGQGQESLYNVLKAYSLYDTEVGYCQGSPFLVGLLLMQMPEEESFCTLVRIMYDYAMRELFKPGMLALEICLHQFDNLILEFMPDLHQHFKAQGVEVGMFASQWFLTMFAASLPLPAVNRIMDIFFSEGMHTLFRFALAFLELEKGVLLALDFDEILVHLKNGMTKKYKKGDSPLTNELVKKAVDYRLSTRTLGRLEKEFIAEKQRQAMEMDEISRLRRDLQKSQERIQELNAENKILADRLLQAQVVDFQNKEEIYRLNNEVQLARNADENARLVALLRPQKESMEKELADVLAQLVDLKMKYAELQCCVSMADNA